MICSVAKEYGNGIEWNQDGVSVWMEAAGAK